MATLAETVPAGLSGLDEERGYFVFRGGGWELYERLLDWADTRRGVKIIYCDGDVLVMARTRRHDWHGHRINTLVFALARAAGIACEDAGETTYRRPPHKAGAQGDDAFYFGANAEHMAGPKDDDPATDPVPDLVLEVEVHHPVTFALAAWARMGVPEVWHVDARVAKQPGLRVLRRTEGGQGYAPVTRSGVLPFDGAEILGLLRQSVGEVASEWQGRLAERVAAVVAARR